MKCVQRTLFFRGAPYRTRETRLATGMSKTHAPQGWPDTASLEGRKRDVLRLVVHGTTDLLASNVWQFHTKRVLCPYCGGRGAKRALSEGGRKRLHRMQKQKALIDIHENNL